LLLALLSSSTGGEKANWLARRRGKKERGKKPLYRSRVPFSSSYSTKEKKGLGGRWSLGKPGRTQKGKKEKGFQTDLDIPSSRCFSNATEEKREIEKKCVISNLDRNGKKKREKVLHAVHVSHSPFAEALRRDGEELKKNHQRRGKKGKKRENSRSSHQPYSRCKGKDRKKTSIPEKEGKKKGGKKNARALRV